MVDEVDGFEEQVASLEATMSEAGAMTQAFTAEIAKVQSAMAATSRDAEVLSKGLSRGLRSAFDGLVFDGMRASDALETVARSAINSVYGAAVRPVTQSLGGLLSQGIAGLFADGAAFSQGRVTPFADGGVVSSATYFPMRGGTGLMGEAGPEAIMPLSRGADGKLGVRSEGAGRVVQVVMNIQTQDAHSFQRSQSQIAAQMDRALSRSARNR